MKGQVAVSFARIRRFESQSFECDPIPNDTSTEE
jgi:hypothetical protein